MDLKQFIRDIPDFPKKGILFRDISPLLKNSEAFEQAVEQMSAPFRGKGIDVVIGPESRGFIFGVAVAQRLGAGFVAARKKGRLPYKTISAKYELEYRKDEMEIHEDAVMKGEKVLIVDDLLATGGTASAVQKLVKMLGGELVGSCFFVELEELKGRSKLEGEVFSLLKY